MKPRKLKAFELQTGEPLGEMEFKVDFDGDPYCPKCGKVMEYWYGQIDQDFMGNDIDGFNHVCYGCEIQTEVMDGDGGYDHDY
jgi:hypothetical protein